MTSSPQFQASAEDSQQVLKAPMSPNATNTAQTKSPNCHGKKKQSTLEFTKERTPQSPPTNSLRKSPCHHKLNGKKAKTTGATPPRKIDEDKLNLTQVNMDIEAGVNLEAAVTGMPATATASTESSASNATGAAGAQTVVIARSGVTGANLAVGTQDFVTIPLRGRNLEDQFNKPETHKLKGLKVASSSIFPDLAAENKDVMSLQCGKQGLRTLILTHSGKWTKAVMKTSTLLVIGDKPGKSEVDKAN